MTAFPKGGFARAHKDRPNVLIVKTGALGDVARTTPLLRALEANVYWITERRALDILPRRALAGACDLKSWRRFSGVRFDTIFSLEENARAAAVAAGFAAREFIGVFPAAGGKLRYSESSSPWFDMGLISRFGREKADALKKKNRKSYQEILFGMTGLKFSGEEYWVEAAPPRPAHPRRGSFLVGLEPTVGKRWPGKAWPGYSGLAARLRRAGFAIKILRRRAALADYVSDIAACDGIISGDTLAMHLALALGKRAAAIFLCTSSWEIHGYGRLEKITSPRLLRDFYRRDIAPAAAKAVTVDEVFSAAQRCFRASGLSAPKRHAARPSGRAA